MMGRCSQAVLLVALLASPCGAADALKWVKLAGIPDDEGFAGPFAGVANGALVVAGGANFPDARPWEGGTKVWYDTIFVLDKPDGEWRLAGKLPRPLAYGISITTDRGLVCIGGADAKRHYADCFLLRLEDHEIIVPLPELPRPCAYACGALLGNTIYVAGGTERPDATRAMHTFWSIDLNAGKPRWVEQRAWPGPERTLAAAGGQDGSFYLFGGTSLAAGEDGQPVRTYLRDAYRFSPATGWKPIAEMPRPAVAAPTPTAAVGPSHLLVIGGDDGAQIGHPQASHRGFPRGVLAYHTITDSWTRQGNVPFSLVTTPAVRWHGRIIIPGGEAKPGVRSTEVWAGE